MKLLILLIAVTGQSVFASSNSLQMALAFCQLDKVNQLLARGADVNAKDHQGNPVVGWVASNRRCTDDAALDTLKVLAEHGAHFEYHLGATDFLTIFANRHLPNALAFLATRKESGDPTKALKAIAESGDRASIRVLLNAGADPKVLAPVTPPPRPQPIKLPCERQALSPELEKLLFVLKIQRDCKFVQACGDQVLIDCNSAADGPAYYIDKKAGTVLATCGGACMRGNCTNCPPKGWTCECKL